MTTEGTALTRPTPPSGPDAEAFRAFLQDEAVQEGLRRITAVFDTPLCVRCLGRPVSRIARGLDNPEKGALVIDVVGLSFTMEPTECPWCEGLFEETDHFTELIAAALAPFECDTLLLATRVHPDVQKFEAMIEAAGGEALAEHLEPMKTELNRVLAGTVLPRLGVEGRFDRADIVVLLDPYFDTVEVTPGSLFLYGRYRKYDRTIPQTKWPCMRCQGEGCKRCDDTGKMYETSVEELVAEVALVAFDAVDESFHGSGREDIDALMLGTGRPFVLELKEPRFRRPRAPLEVTAGTEGSDERKPATIDAPVLDLALLEEMINARTRPRVEIEGLRASDKNEVVAIKEAALDKAYRAHVIAETPISRDALDAAILKVLAAPIQQETPTRVMHRRADKVRERSVHRVETVAFGHHERAAHEAMDAALPAPQVEGDTVTHFTLDIDAESGTYIKELVHGDEGRTQPSFAGLVGVPMRVVALDVVGVGEGPGSTPTS